MIDKILVFLGGYALMLFLTSVTRAAFGSLAGIVTAAVIVGVVGVILESFANGFLDSPKVKALALGGVLALSWRCLAG